MIRFIKRICLLGMLIISITISAHATQGQLQTSAGDTVVANACTLDPLTSTQVSENAASFTAQWTPNPHTVTYLCGTGASGTPPTAQSINFDATFTVTNSTGANCTKSGYGFSAWACKYLNGANNTPSTVLNNNAQYTIDKDAQCTATWAGNIITLNWNKGGHPNAYSDVPEIYQPVEYIQSSGTQYIDTGVKGPAKIIIDVQGTAIGTASNVVVGSSSASPSWFGQAAATGRWGMNTGAALSNVAYTDRIKATIMFQNSANYTINNIPTTYNNSGTFNTSNNFTLFSVLSGTAYSYKAKAKIYSFQIIKNNELVQNLVPVRRKADNVVGMYDTVNGDFLENAGTGTFTAGNDIDIVAPDSCIYGSTFTMPVALLDTGYTFNKWNVNNKTFDAEQTEVACNYTNLGVYSGSATVTASWTAHTIDLTWNKLAGDATPHATNTCTYDGDITLPTEPTRTGFSFMGWTLDND